MACFLNMQMPFRGDPALGQRIRIGWFNKLPTWVMTQWSKITFWEILLWEVPYLLCSDIMNQRQQLLFTKLL